MLHFNKSNSPNHSMEVKSNEGERSLPSCVLKATWRLMVTLGLLWQGLTGPAPASAHPYNEEFGGGEPRTEELSASIKRLEQVAVSHRGAFEAREANIARQLEMAYYLEEDNPIFKAIWNERDNNDWKDITHKLAPLLGEQAAMDLGWNIDRIDLLKLFKYLKRVEENPYTFLGVSYSSNGETEIIEEEELRIALAFQCYKFIQGSQINPVFNAHEYYMKTRDTEGATIALPEEGVNIYTRPITKEEMQWVLDELKRYEENESPAVKSYLAIMRRTIESEEVTPPYVALQFWLYSASIEDKELVLDFLDNLPLRLQIALATGVVPTTDLLKPLQNMTEEDMGRFLDLNPYFAQISEEEAQNIRGRYPVFVIGNNTYVYRYDKDTVSPISLGSYPNFTLEDLNKIAQERLEQFQSPGEEGAIEVSAELERYINEFLSSDNDIRVVVEPPVMFSISEENLDPPNGRYGGGCTYSGPNSIYGIVDGMVLHWTGGESCSRDVSETLINSKNLSAIAVWVEKSVNTGGTSTYTVHIRHPFKMYGLGPAILSPRMQAAGENGDWVYTNQSPFNDGIGPLGVPLQFEISGQYFDDKIVSPEMAKVMVNSNLRDLFKSDDLYAITMAIRAYANYLMEDGMNPFNITGHNEVTIYGKVDPGEHYLALVRAIILVDAFYNNRVSLSELNDYLLDHPEVEAYMATIAPSIIMWIQVESRIQLTPHKVDVIGRLHEPFKTVDENV